jgi:hypothetical protein
MGNRCNKEIQNKGKQRMWNVGGLIVGSLGALYFFKTVQPLAERGLRNYFFKPTLISRSITVHNSPLSAAFNRLYSVFVKPQPIPEVILEPHLQQKMNAYVVGLGERGKQKRVTSNLYSFFFFVFYNIIESLKGQRRPHREGDILAI